MTLSTIPDFDSLPKVEGMPQGCAWGIFDKDGKKDYLGTINLLTPEVVKAAAAEVKEGVSVSLNWPMNAIAQPGFGRKEVVHDVIYHNETGDGVYGFDDEVSFNTQCSSQWDSLCHYGHQPSGCYYNGQKGNITEKLVQKFGDDDENRDLPTLNHWHSRGGLVARGVLIDYKAWADKNNVKYNSFDSYRIKISEIEKVAADQGVTFRQGDVFIIRSGFTEALSAMNAREQVEAMSSHRTCGVEGTLDSAKWFWNQHFAAVAGDAIGFEAIPPIRPDTGEEGGISELYLHQYFLSLFGMPIGELWDLKALSEQCAKSGRYTFLLTSCPMNVGGLVGSPPNALAVF